MINNRIYTKAETKKLVWHNFLKIISILVIFYVLWDYPVKWLQSSILKGALIVSSVFLANFFINFLNEIFVLVKLRKQKDDFAYYLHKWKIYSTEEKKYFNY